jgi:hypothetical protein
MEDVEAPVLHGVREQGDAVLGDVVDPARKKSGGVFVPMGGKKHPEPEGQVEFIPFGSTAFLGQSAHPLS